MSKHIDPRFVKPRPLIDDMLNRIDEELRVNALERALNDDVSIRILVDYGKLPAEALLWSGSRTV